MSLLMKSNFDRLAYYLAVAHAVAVVHFSATAHPVEFVVHFAAELIHSVLQ